MPEKIRLVMVITCHVVRTLPHVKYVLRHCLIVNANDDQRFQKEGRQQITFLARIPPECKGYRYSRSA
jgi:hypothetical protein